MCHPADIFPYICSYGKRIDSQNIVGMLLWNAAFLAIELAAKYHRTCCNAKSAVTPTQDVDFIIFDMLGSAESTLIFHALVADKLRKIIKEIGKRHVLLFP
jgi:hypothetical protein